MRRITGGNVFKTHLSRAIAGAALVAIVVVALYNWGERHDNPPPVRRSSPRESEITFNGRQVQVTTECSKCPEHLIENHTRELSFDFTFTLKQATASSGGAIPKMPPGPRVFAVINAGNSAWDITQFIVTENGYDLLSTSPLKGSVTIHVMPVDASLSQITFDFKSGSAEQSSSLGRVAWLITSERSALGILVPYAIAVLVFGFAAGAFYWADSRLTALRERTDRKIAEVKSQADADPKQARFAWNLALVKLEAYFDRNLLQVNSVFWVAVLVMLVGFGFVLTGVFLAYAQQGGLHALLSTASESTKNTFSPNITPASLLAAVSGIITQFIGATFMVIYRSTMAQANEFMTVLERINTVGMAVQVLDSLPEESDLKQKTRAEMVLLLLKSKA